MKVTLVSQPQITDSSVLHRLESDYEDINDVTDADLLFEDAGRGCYRSWHRPNPATRTNKDYLGKSILARRHFSVIEHGTFVFHVEGVSRALLAELTRHRHVSFSVESLRFCPPRGYVIHPTLKSHWEPMERVVDDAWHACLGAYFVIFDYLTKQGLPKKQCREAARMVLPMMTTTDLYVSANARAWRDVINQRWDPEADREICELAGEFLRHLKAAAPNTFQDMPEPALITL